MFGRNRFLSAEGGGNAPLTIFAGAFSVDFASSNNVEGATVSSNGIVYFCGGEPTNDA